MWVNVSSGAAFLLDLTILISATVSAGSVPKDGNSVSSSGSSTDEVGMTVIIRKKQLGISRQDKSLRRTGKLSGGGGTLMGRLIAGENAMAPAPTDLSFSSENNSGNNGTDYRNQMVSWGPVNFSRNYSNSSIINDVERDQTRLKSQAKRANVTNSYKAGIYTGFISSGEEETSALLVIRLAQCRAACFAKKMGRDDQQQLTTSTGLKSKISSKLTQEDSQMSFDDCWDTCLLLEIQSGAAHPSKLADIVCELNTSTCLSGCQDACEFHRIVQHPTKITTERIEAVLAATRVEPSLSLRIKAIFPRTRSPTVTKNKRKDRRKKKYYQLDLSWPAAAAVIVPMHPTTPAEPAVVYSVVQHVQLRRISPGWTWRLVEQTTKNSISITLPERPREGGGEIRVLATTPHSLIRVFSVKRGASGNDAIQSGINTNVTSSSSSNSSGGNTRLGQDRTNPHAHNIEWPHGDSKSATPPTDPSSWQLRKVSMVHQDLLVLVQVSWSLPSPLISTASGGSTTPLPPPPPPLPLHTSGPNALVKPPSNGSQGTSSRSSPREQVGHEVPEEAHPGSNHSFLITWQVLGGALKGNLVTDTDTATISLWPDAVYSIQVGLIDAQDEKKTVNPWDLDLEPKVSHWSRVLRVNTSEAVVTAEHRTQRISSFSSVDFEEERPGARSAAAAAAAESNFESLENRTKSSSDKAIKGEKTESTSSGNQAHHTVAHAMPISSGGRGGDRDEGEEDEEGEEEEGEGEEGNDDGDDLDEEEDRVSNPETLEARPYRSSSSSSGFPRRGSDGSGSGVGACECWRRRDRWKLSWCDCEEWTVSWAVILGSIYGLLIIVSILVYLIYAFRLRPTPLRPCRFWAHEDCLVLLRRRLGCAVAAKAPAADDALLTRSQQPNYGDPENLLGGDDYVDYDDHYFSKMTALQYNIV